MSPSRSATRILRSQSLWWVAKKMSAVRGTWTAVWRGFFCYVRFFNFLLGSGQVWWVSQVMMVVVVVVLLGVFVEKKGRTLRWMKLSLMSSSVSGSFSGRGSGGGESRIL